nr:uncharacterized protein LOC117280145 [Nicotiana tomentosiformis]
MGKANVVGDALTRKARSMGRLAFIPGGEKPLAMDVHAFANRMMRLDILEPRKFLACVVYQSEARLLGTTLIRDALVKVKLIQEWLHTAQSRQKNYYDRKVCDVVFKEGEKLDENLAYDEQPMSILDREGQKLKSKNIASLNVQWRGQ